GGCLRGGRATSGRAAAGPPGEEAKEQLFERRFSGHWPDGASSATASPDGPDAGSPAQQDRGTGADHPANTRQGALEQVPRTYEETVFPKPKRPPRLMHTAACIYLKQKCAGLI